ncbi:MAG: glycosyltransferase family 2 protein [Planctomycetes bacterium]|nr:glycosyltransferase family 2 protein [Planctomycetota bacterium]
MTALAPRVSVAIPVFNEADVLPELLRRLMGVLEGLPGGPHEVVFVDDGSSDATVSLLKAAAERDLRISIVALSRNFGHQAAITAALDHAHGDAVVVMDADLQDPPEAIPTLLAKLAEGFDVVYARRGERHEPWYLRACYYLFYRLIAVLSDTRLPLDAGDFAVLSRPVIEAMRSAPERHRYLRGLRSWVGFRQTGITVDRGTRVAGVSKYRPLKLLRLAFDGLFAFSTVPLRAAAVVGGVAVAGSLLFVAYAVYAKLVLDQSPQGFTALIVAIVFSLGVQLMFLGVIGEYVGRVYEEVKGRPHYVVREVIRHT